MRKLLVSTTALSVAFSPFGTMPGFAQVLNEDGSVTGADGTEICMPTADVACDLQAIIDALMATDPAAAEALAAPQVVAAAAEGADDRAGHLPELRADDPRQARAAARGVRR